MAEVTPSYELTIETDQRAGSFGERFQNISRNHVPGFRSRSIGTYGQETQVPATFFFLTKADAETHAASLEEKIGSDIMLKATRGVIDPEVLYNHHVRLIDAPPAEPMPCYDSHLGDCFKVELVLIVQRMA